MAKLKSLRAKSKEYIFSAFGNDKDERPAKIIFSRFPVLNETFVNIDKKSLLEGIDIASASRRELEPKIADKIVESFLSNMRAGNIDFRRFFQECVEGFKDLEYGDSKIITVNDFWQTLPPDAVDVIAQEALEYASERDEFTMGNLNA